MRIKERVAVMLATGFGLGYSPVASGTFGTLLGIPLVWFLQGQGTWAYAAWTLVGIFAAVPVCGIAERVFVNKDDGRIVADEFMTFPLVLWGLPFTWQMILVAFFTHRIMDIIKPPPARGLQELHGGVGIMIDDVIAGVYALALNHLIFRWFLA